MNRIAKVSGLVAVIFVAGGLLFGDDKVPAKVKGQLPANWSKLGLTDEQKQSIYSIQNDFRPKIDKLEQEIKKLKKQERTDMEAVLTDAQKARLREILRDKGPADGSSKDSKGTNK